MFASLADTAKTPVVEIVEVTVSVPSNVHVTPVLAPPVASTVAVNCWEFPLDTVAVDGVTVTVLTAGFSVVKHIAFANWEVLSVCQ